MRHAKSDQLTSLGRLDAFDVLSTGTLGALAEGIFHRVSLAKFFERVRAGTPMKEEIAASFFLCNEAEALIRDEFFDRSLWHVLNGLVKKCAAEALLAIPGTLIHKRFGMNSS